MKLPGSPMLISITGKVPGDWNDDGSDAEVVTEGAEGDSRNSEAADGKGTQFEMMLTGMLTAKVQ